MYLEESDVCSHLVGRKIENECHATTFGIPVIGIFIFATTIVTFIYCAWLYDCWQKFHVTLNMKLKYYSIRCIFLNRVIFQLNMSFNNLLKPTNILGKLDTSILVVGPRTPLKSQSLVLLESRQIPWDNYPREVRTKKNRRFIALRTRDKGAGYETYKLVGAPRGMTYTFDQDFPVDIFQNKERYVRISGKVG